MDQYKISQTYQQKAESLFEQAWRRGQFKRILAIFTRQSRLLPMLSTIEDRAASIEVEELETQPVRVENIIGTQGKLSFDRDFLPLQRRSKDRWVGICMAMLRDAVTLPPISVIQVGEDYYVHDGNHRVSVAKRLRRLYLEADVTRWIVTYQ
jgi:hypothetical protein